MGDMAGQATHRRTGRLAKMQGIVPLEQDKTPVHRSLDRLVSRRG